MSRSLEIIEDVSSGLTMVTKRMFGGHGFFAPNGGMFAGIVTDDAIVLKLALGPARDELIALGGRPWTYDGKSKPMTMKEWIVVPDSFYDDAETLSAWLLRAHSLAPAKAAARKAARSPRAGNKSAARKR